MRHLYVHSPEVLASGQINDSFSGVYPVADIPVKNVTGDFDIGSAVTAGMTVIFGSAAGLDDRGRQRIRSVFANDTLLIGYSSRGKHDGEIDIEADDYFTILNDYRVWSKVQRFVYDENTVPVVTEFKDYDEIFASHGEGVLFFPKANSGRARAGTIDADTGLLTVAFGGGANSYSMPASVGIASYLWDVGDGTITFNTETDQSIIATFPAGFRYVSLTVTDNNGLAHTMRTPVYARDPANDTCVEAWQLESRQRTAQGQQVSLRILSDLPRSTYPDGALVLLFDDDDINHDCEFWGWHQTDNASLEFVRTAALRDTVLECLDVAARLDTLPGQSQIIEHIDKEYTFTVADAQALGAELVTVAAAPVDLRDGDVLIGPGAMEIEVTSYVAAGSTAFGVEPLTASLAEGDLLTFTLRPRLWSQMYRPGIYAMIDYLLRWHSTALELADFYWPVDDADLGFLSRESSADTLLRQVMEQARAIVPDHRLLCTRHGQLKLEADPMLQPLADRTVTVQADLAGKVARVSVLHQRPPRAHWIRGGAVLAGWTYSTDDVEVAYTIIPSAETAAGATTLPVEAIPVDLPNGAQLDVDGLGVVIVTLTASASAGATSLSVAALPEIVFASDELFYTATEDGEPYIPTVFCIAPGRVPGQGEQSISINNKIATNQTALNVAIGHLYAALNAEYGAIEITLAGEDDLGIEPALGEWITMGPFADAAVPQRDLPIFTKSDPSLPPPPLLLPLEVREQWQYDKRGPRVTITIRAIKETWGGAAQTITGGEL